MSFSTLHFKSGLVSSMMRWWSGDQPVDKCLVREQDGVGQHEGIDSMTIQFENNGIVVAGTELKGFVQIRHSSPLPSGSSIILEISGRECVALVGDMEMSRSIMASSFPLCTVERDLDTGLLTFPFTFSVSKKLPASVSLRTDRHDVSLTYSLIGRIMHANGEEELKQFTCENRFYVAFRPTNVGPCFGAVRNCTISMKARVQQDIFTEGRVIQMKVLVNSTSVKPISGMVIFLQQNIMVRFPLGEVKRIRTTILGEYLGFEPCFLGERYFEVVVPSVDGEYTVKGAMISVQYTLGIRLNVIDSATPLEAFIPICIVPDHVSQKVAYLAPTNLPVRPHWQPDENALCCTKCKRNFFSFAVWPRRHHCRHCGQVFCVWCCKRWTNMTQLSFHSPARVCDDCFPIAMFGENSDSKSLSHKGSDHPIDGASTSPVPAVLLVEDPPTSTCRKLPSSVSEPQLQDQSLIRPTIPNVPTLPNVVGYSPQ